MCSEHKSVLFVGNSYIYVNDLPDVLSKLAAAGGHSLSVKHVTRGGARLENFLCEEDELYNALKQNLENNKWDFIVLQEQSQIPSVPEERQNRMYPSIRSLNNWIKSLGAETILYMTWGRKLGDNITKYKDFESMQEAIKEGYTTIAEEISALIAPVGMAWLKAKQKQNDIELWKEDGSHPSIMGTYLTACVFYTLLFKESPVHLKFTAGLTDNTARFLQETALETMQV